MPIGEGAFAAQWTACTVERLSASVSSQLKAPEMSEKLKTG